jgi:hypothetical protein
VRAYLDGGCWRLTGEHTEIESGKLRDRPQLRAALEQCRLTGATLVIAKLDRLSRNVAFLAQLMDDSDVPFVAVDNPHAIRFTLHILAAVAEHEAAQISKRTRDALAAAKARGKRLGGWRAPRGAGSRGCHQAPFRRPPWLCTEGEGSGACSAGATDRSRAEGPRDEPAADGGGIDRAACGDTARRCMVSDFGAQSASAGHADSLNIFRGVASSGGAGRTTPQRQAADGGSVMRPSAPADPAAPTGIGSGGTPLSVSRNDIQQER